jgi:hypothetical protein
MSFSTIFNLLKKIREYSVVLSKLIFIGLSLYYLWNFSSYAITINLTWWRDFYIIGRIFNIIESFGMFIMIIPLSIVLLSFVYPDVKALRISSGFLGVAGSLFGLFHGLSQGLLEERFKAGFVTIYHQVKLEHKELLFKRIFDSKLQEHASTAADPTGYVAFIQEGINKYWTIYLDKLQLMGVDSVEKFATDMFNALNTQYIQKLNKANGAIADTLNNGGDSVLWGAAVITVKVVFVVIGVIGVAAIGYWIWNKAVEHARNVRDIAQLQGDTLKIVKDTNTAGITTTEYSQTNAKLVEDLNTQVKTLTELVGALHEKHNEGVTFAEGLKTQLVEVTKFMAKWNSYMIHDTKLNSATSFKLMNDVTNEVIRYVDIKLGKFTELVQAIDNKNDDIIENLLIQLKKQENAIQDLPSLLTFPVTSLDTNISNELEKLKRGLSIANDHITALENKNNTEASMENKTLTESEALNLINQLEERLKKIELNQGKSAVADYAEFRQIVDYANTLKSFNPEQRFSKAYEAVKKKTDDRIDEIAEKLKAATKKMNGDKSYIEAQIDKIQGVETSAELAHSETILLNRSVTTHTKDISQNKTKIEQLESKLDTTIGTLDSQQKINLSLEDLVQKHEVKNQKEIELLTEVVKHNQETNETEIGLLKTQVHTLTTKIEQLSTMVSGFKELFSNNVKTVESIIPTPVVNNNNNNNNNGNGNDEQYSMSNENTTDRELKCMTYSTSLRELKEITRILSDDHNNLSKVEKAYLLKRADVLEQNLSNSSGFDPGTTRMYFDGCMSNEVYETELLLIREEKAILNKENSKVFFGLRPKTSSFREYVANREKVLTEREQSISNMTKLESESSDIDSGVDDEQYQID